jgi:hypothetical protein
MTDLPNQSPEPTAVAAARARFTRADEDGVAEEMRKSFWHRRTRAKAV